MSGAAFGVTFDDAALAEDLAHASAPGRAVALDARRQFAANGSPPPCCALAATRAATERVCPGA